ncbi:hypothetical protein A2389_02940 [Candidatus Adlerbacteria bacterium RIFOXYB1_FULL_48_10]|nr:MAG: hypothetical protein A2389_02940 [Candidatus Adlerbacteria bacterium RIFOXYB1_FULL_48_10]
MATSFISQQRTVFAAPDSENLELALKMSRLFEGVTTKALPSVVSISTVKSFDPRKMESLRALDPEMQMDPELPGGEMPKALGMGSGIVIRSDGMILTNSHVVEGAEHISVALDDKHKAQATVVGIDPKTDLAVIHIDQPAPALGPISAFRNLPVLEFGNSDDLKVGDLTIAIGSPYGLSKSVSFGIISAKGRAQMGVLETEDFIQTDAAINPGSSGGPLLNTKGQVVGISTAIFSQNGGFAGIGFAIPASIASEIGEQLIKNGYVSRGWMGITAQDLDNDLAEFFESGDSNEKGAVISEVEAASPVKTMIRPGDVVIKVNKKPVEDAAHLKSIVTHSHSGQKLTFDIRRDGNSLELELPVSSDPKAAKAPRKQLAGKAATKKDKKATTGIAVENIPAEIQEFLGDQVHAGVIIIDVSPGTPAFDAGLSTGDIILKVNKTHIGNTKDYSKAVKELKNNSLTVLYVQRGPDEKLFVPLRIT